MILYFLFIIYYFSFYPFELDINYYDNRYQKIGHFNFRIINFFLSEINIINFNLRLVVYLSIEIVQFNSHTSCLIYFKIFSSLYIFHLNL